MASKSIPIFIYLVAFFILITLRSNQAFPTVLKPDVARILRNAQNFSIFESLLEASKVDKEIEQGQGTAGISLFVSMDNSFDDVPDKFKSLPIDDKANVMRFHVLGSYYTASSLNLLVDPLQPTLATRQVGAGRFTLSIKNVNGSVIIDTGIVQASVTRLVYDQTPLAIYCVSKFLLPMELFRN